MNGILLTLGLIASEPPSVSPATPADSAIRRLSTPCPRRFHINEPNDDGEGSHLMYRPDDLYNDCADELDLLSKTRESVEERLLRSAEKGKDLPERYRAAWILIQRRNEKVIPTLAMMAESPDTEERYLAWSAYTWGVRKRQLPVPRSFDLVFTQFKNEKNRYVRSLMIGFLGDCRAKEAVPLLLEELKKDDLDAVSALGQIRDPKTVPAIIAQAKKANWNRHIYFRALGQIGSPEAVDYLIERLDDGCFAVKALFDSGSPKGLPAIEQYLARLKKDKEPDELSLAVAQVSVLRLKHLDPREHLLLLAEDVKQSRWMRTKALEALGHYDRTLVAKRLLKLYRAESDDWTRMFLIRVLRDLPGDDITEAMIDQAVAGGKDAYQHSHWDLREALNQRLGLSFRTMKPLIEYLESKRESKGK